MAEEYQEEGGFPQIVQPGFDTDSNPVNSFRQAITADRIANRPIPSGRPDLVKTGLNVAGNYRTGPRPGSQDDNDGTLNLVRDKIDFIKGASQWASDPDAYARANYYGGGIHGANFERYYNHPKFKKLDFNPMRNNEALYNQNSSWWDDFNRMTTSLGGLMWTGFKSPWDFGSKNTAREFEKHLAVGMTSQEGVGGFFTNFFLNTGFTLGITAEIVAENFAIAGATYLTRGRALGMSSVVGKNAMGIRKLYQMGESVKATKELLKRLLNPAYADEFYRTANGEKSAIRKIGDFINPFSNTTDYISNLSKGANGFDKLNDFAKTRKAFGAFYRDLREMNMTTSESLMEGEMASNEKNRQKIDAFYRKNGYMPEGDDAERIYNESKSTGQATAIANIPVIFFTNRLIFNDLFRGFKPPSVVGDELLKGTQRTLEKTKGWKIGENAFTFQERMAGSKLKKILWDNSYVPWGKKYMLGNLGEGVQEIAQEITSSAASKYYERLYSDPAAAGFYNALVAVGESAGEQWSMKGLETFLSGYLTGSVVQGVGKVFTSHKWAPGLYKEYFKSEEYQKQVSQQRERENQIVNAANTIAKNPLGYFADNVEHGLRVKQLSNDMEDAETNGDEKAFHDAKNDLLYEHLYTLAHTGKMDMLVDWMDGMSQLDDKAISEAFNQDQTESGAIRNRLQNAVTKAKQFQGIYSTFNERFKNPFNPLSAGRDDDDNVLSEEMANYLGFNHAKKDAILSTMLYSKSIERMDSIIQDLASESVIKNANASDVTLLLDPALLNDEIDTLKKEAEVLSMGDQKQKQEGKEKKEKMETLIKMRDLKLQHEMAMQDARKSLNEEERASRNFAVGSTVRKKRSGEKVTILADMGDKVQVMNEYGNKVLVKKSAILPYRDVVHNTMREANRMLYNQFLSYMKMLAKQSGDTQLNEQKVMQAFVKVRDHMVLKNDANKMMDTVNMLNNPEYFMQYAARMAQVEKVKRQNKPEYIRSSFKALKEKEKNDAFLNEIFDLGFTIDPDDAELIKKGFYNVSLYHANTGVEVKETDKKYAEAMEIIEKYTKITEENKKEASEEEEMEDEDEEEVITQTPVSTIPVEQRLDVSTDQYKEVVKLFRKLELEKAKNGETTLGLEGLSDNELASNEDFVEFTKTNSAAIKILKSLKVPQTPNQEQMDQLDWTPQPVPTGLEKLKNLFKRVLYLTKDERHYFDEQGNLHNRVSDIKGEDDFKGLSPRISRRAQQRGNVIDKVVRELFNGKVETYDDMRKLINNEIREKKYEIQFERKAVEDLFSILSSVKKQVDGMGWKVHSTIPVLTGNFPGLKLDQKGRVAGTIDLLVEQGGEFFIIDLKTATLDRKSEEGQQRYAQKDAIQLNAYREMIEQATGVKIEAIFIFPITVTQTGGYKTISTVSAPEFNRDGLIYVPIAPVRELAPDMFEGAPPAPGAAPTAPAPADAKADIEKEKAKITPSEFTELKRLAKFFLENPKEPTVSGSVVTRYPTLFKAITDIERRRQESINNIKQRPNETLFTAPYYKKGYNFKQLPTDSAMRTEAEEKEYYEILKNNNALTDVSIQVKTREEAEKLINAKYDAELAAQGKPTADAKADIEKKHTFTRESMDDISKGTGLTRKGSKITNPKKVESQLSVGDKIEFFAERKRTGVWNGTYVIEDGTNNPWGVLGIIGSTTGYIKNITKIEAELAALGTAPAGKEVDKDVYMNLLNQLKGGKPLEDFTAEEQAILSDQSLLIKYDPELAKQMKLIPEGTDTSTETEGTDNKKKYKGDELQNMVSAANTPIKYERLKKELYRLLRYDPHFRDFFGLNADRVREILAEKYAELSMSFTLDDLQSGIFAKTKDGRNMKLVNVTKDTFSLVPIDESEQPVSYSKDNAYDIIESIYKPGMENISPPTTAPQADVEQSTREVSDKGMQDGQLTADKVNQLNAQVNNTDIDDIDNNVLKDLCS